MNCLISENFLPRKFFGVPAVTKLMPQLILFLLFVSLLGANHSFADTPYITIIIDDIGNNEARGIRTAELKGPVTLAILPNRPYSKELAELAHKNNKEVILHAPMQNLRNIALGQGALTTELKGKAFRTELTKSINSIPYIIGINNHMGSLLTTKHLQMNWTMQIVKEKKLFFVDSKTNAKSIAKDVALIHQIPSVARDVFLDHERTASFIDKQFEKCLNIARRTGHCLLIGHPYPETLNHLEAAIPKLKARGIEQKRLSTWVKEKNRALTKEQSL